MRSQFGFMRTENSGPEDVLPCQHMPGYLVGDDLLRIAAHLRFSPRDFAEQFLLASSGTVVESQGEKFYLPTLVPKRGENGHCIFLEDNNLCGIHDVSPYGCAFFDSQMSDEEFSKRRAAGAADLWRIWIEGCDIGQLYVDIWWKLNEKGMIALSPKVTRPAYEAALAALRNPV